jgi:hypothetical protein
MVVTLAPLQNHDARLRAPEPMTTKSYEVSRIVTGIRPIPIARAGVVRSVRRKRNVGDTEIAAPGIPNFDDSRPGGRL